MSFDIEKEFKILHDKIDNIKDNQDNLMKKFMELEESVNKKDGVLLIDMFADLKESITRSEFCITDLVLQRTRSDEVSNFYNNILEVIEREEWRKIPYVIKRLAKFAYLDNGIIKIPCADKKLYGVLEETYTEEINKYSDNEVKFVLVK